MTYLRLLWEFLKIGAFTFGGGYAMIPMIKDAVMANDWMTMEEMIDFIAISESTPGPVAINMATYVGTQTAGVFGAICATLGVVLPSFVIILLVAKFFSKFGNSTPVKGVMRGVQPAAIGLIAAAIYSIGNNVLIVQPVIISNLATKEFWTSIVIFGITLFLGIKKAHPIIMILVAAALGIAANLILG